MSVQSTKGPLQRRYGSFLNLQKDHCSVWESKVIVGTMQDNIRKLTQQDKVQIQLLGQSLLAWSQSIAQYEPDNHMARYIIT